MSKRAEKYIVVVGDGMGDYPLEALGGKTPLEYAPTPTLDRLAAHGEMGVAITIPEGMPPGSDVANMSLLGYDPRGVITGRGPLEAAAMGITLAPGEVAFRCNLVTLGTRGGELVMEDYSAGHISTEEAREIIHDLRAATEGLPLTLFPGVSYRHVLIWSGGDAHLTTTPPHDILGREVSTYRKVYDETPVLRSFIERAEAILSRHPVNEARRLQQIRPVTSLWPWGQGVAPSVPTLTERCGLRGVMISAVDLLKGLGVYAGLETPRIEGATGYLDTNYEGKVRTAVDKLHHLDLAYIHIEAPDETSHEGSVEKKLTAIEHFDAKVLRPLVEMLTEREWSVRMLVVTDHLTPLQVRTHVADPVPFLMIRDLHAVNAHPCGVKFCERNAERAQGGRPPRFAWDIVATLLGCDAARAD